MKKLFFIAASSLMLASCGFGAGVFAFSSVNDQCRNGRISKQEAFSDFKNIADKDNTAGALLMVARMYAQGDGTKRDIAKAKEYYQKAAKTEWRFNVEGYAKQELAELNSKGRLLYKRSTCPASNNMGGLAY